MIENQIKTVMLLGLLSALVIWVGNLIGGYSGMSFALIFVIGMNLVSYFFSDKIVLFMYHAKEADRKKYPKLYSIIREVSTLAKIPMPKVYVLPTLTPNAFATGRNPNNAAVACTVGITQLLTETELKAVIAHEISHIKNRDILIQTIASTMAGVIAYIAAMARWAAIFGGLSRDNDKGNSIFELLALAILTPLIATLLQLAISRSREYIADESGAKIIKNPLALASALEKIDGVIKHHPMEFGNASTSSLFIANPFRANFIFNMFSTHPPMVERVKRLREMKI